MYKAVVHFDAHSWIWVTKKIRTFVCVNLKCTITSHCTKTLRKNPLISIIIMFLLESKWVFQCSLTLPYNKTYKNNPAKSFQASNALKHKSLNRDIQDISLHIYPSYRTFTGNLSIFKKYRETYPCICLYVYLLYFINKDN